MTTLPTEVLEHRVDQCLTTTPDVVGIVLEQLRSVIDLREEIALLDKKLAERDTLLKAKLISHHESAGIDSLAGGGLNVSFDDWAMREKYDPSKWAEIVKWAVDTGNLHVIQRRLTVKHITDLVREGIALPDGLSLEPYTKVSVRRKS